MYNTFNFFPFGSRLYMVYFFNPLRKLLFSSFVLITCSSAMSEAWFTFFFFLHQQLCTVSQPLPVYFACTSNFADSWDFIAGKGRFRATYAAISRFCAISIHVVPNNELFVLGHTVIDDVLK